MFPTGLNNQGEVVGQFQSGSPLLLKGWHWRPDGTVEVIPAPPGLSSYRAMGINDSGFILGDGGLSWGLAWVLSPDGVFTSVGTLPGDSMSLAAAINEDGVVAGTSRSPSHTSPRTSFVATPGLPPDPLQGQSEATDLSNSGFTIGYYTSQTGFRVSPGGETLLLPRIDGRSFSWPWGVNSEGCTVGGTAFANGNGHIPFLYCDDLGTVPVGTFTGGASAADINDDRTIIGNLSSGGPHPWIWDLDLGIRFLEDLIPPDAGVALQSVLKINERGDILGLAILQDSGDWAPVVLESTAIFADGFESGDASRWSEAVQ